MSIGVGYLLLVVIFFVKCLWMVSNFLEIVVVVSE